MSRAAIEPTLTINEIVTRFPVTVGVFNDWGIDACCGGAKPLEEVARRHQLDLAALRAELEDVVATCECALAKGDIA